MSDSNLSFVAATFSAFMVSQQRQDYDVPMGTSLTPLETLTAEIFFLATLTTISKTLFGHLSDGIWFAIKRRKKASSEPACCLYYDKRQQR